MNFIAMMVDVAPTGSLRNLTGLRVVMGPRRWWSMISTISASPIPSTACDASLWSRRMTDRRTSSSRVVRVRTPASFPSGVTTQAARNFEPETTWRAWASVSVRARTGTLCLHHLAGREREVDHPADAERIEPGGEDRDAFLLLPLR